MVGFTSSFRAESGANYIDGWELSFRFSLGTNEAVSLSRHRITPCRICEWLVVVMLKENQASAILRFVLNDFGVHRAGIVNSRWLINSKLLLLVWLVLVQSACAKTSPPGIKPKIGKWLINKCRCVWSMIFLVNVKFSIESLMIIVLLYFARIIIM